MSSGYRTSNIPLDMDILRLYGRMPSYSIVALAEILVEIRDKYNIRDNDALVRWACEIVALCPSNSRGTKLKELLRTGRVEEALEYARTQMERYDRIVWDYGWRAVEIAKRGIKWRRLDRRDKDAWWSLVKELESRVWEVGLAIADVLAMSKRNAAHVLLKHPREEGLYLVVSVHKHLARYDRAKRSWMYEGKHYFNIYIKPLLGKGKYHRITDNILVV